MKFPCSEHFNELSLYCLTCKKFLCKICVGSTHRTHKYNKNLANKLLAQFESYAQSRNQILIYKNNTKKDEKLKDLDVQLDAYFLKKQTEFNTVITDSIQKFNQQIYKEYNSIIKSKQDKILEQIRKKVKELKSNILYGQRVKLNYEIK